MRYLMHKLVPMLFALSSVLFLIATLIQLIKEEPINIVFPAVALANFTLAVVFFAVGRKARADSGPPSG